MLEARDKRPGRGVVDSPIPFGILRGYYAGGRSRNGSGVHRFVSDNKENIPPEGSKSRSRRRRGRPKKSPLPSWYPRTPLRDVTAIVAAMERRRVRLRNESEMRRRTQEALNSPRTPDRVGSPLALEPSVSEDTPQTLKVAQETSVSEDTPQTLQVAQETSVSVETLQTIQAPACNSAEVAECSTPAESPPQRIKDSTNDHPLVLITPTNDLIHVSIQKKLSEFEEIEKVVRKSMKDSKKIQRQPNTQSRKNTLMSMR